MFVACSGWGLLDWCSGFLSHFLWGFCYSLLGGSGDRFIALAFDRLLFFAGPAALARPVTLSGTIPLDRFVSL